MIYDKHGIEISIVCQRVSSALSIIGSLIIIYQILSNYEQKLKLMHHRIILSMSCCDLIGSIALFVGRWAAPKNVNEEWLRNNVGSQFTCDLQGFILSFGFSSVSVCMTFLSIYYMLSVRYNWREERLKKIEWAFRLLLILCVVISVIPIVNQAYNPYPTFCWVQVS